MRFRSFTAAQTPFDSVSDPQRRRVERARRGAGDRYLLIVTVGRQEFQKGHLDLIEAMAHVRQVVPKR